MNDHDLHFDSKCIHGGQEQCAVTGAVMPAIYTSSTYAQESPGVPRNPQESPGITRRPQESPGVPRNPPASP